MSEQKTIRALKNFKKGVYVCKHIYEVESLELGFNFPKDIETDFDAWCDECENKLNEQGKWTKTALKFADFQPYCYVCFNMLKDFYIEKITTNKPGKYRIWN